MQDNQDKAVQIKYKEQKKLVETLGYRPEDHGFDS
jgi:hypothetical protein